MKTVPFFFFTSIQAGEQKVLKMLIHKAVHLTCASFALIKRHELVKLPSTWEEKLLFFFLFFKCMIRKRVFAVWYHVTRLPRAETPPPPRSVCPPAEPRALADKTTTRAERGRCIRSVRIKHACRHSSQRGVDNKPHNYILETLFITVEI